MIQYQRLAESVKIKMDKNKPTLVRFSELLHLIGKGRSAFVFKIKNVDIALKIFFPNKEKVAREEAKNYQVLRSIDFYPNVYDYGKNYIAIDYIKGYTLFQCLEKGIFVTEDKIKAVDLAIELAKKEGLNPSDIHLKNIIITPEHEIKVIDVARFKQKNSDKQWYDLHNAYYRFYQKPFFPKKLPTRLLNIIAALYKKRFIPYSLMSYFV